MFDMYVTILVDNIKTSSEALPDAATGGYEYNWTWAYGSVQSVTLWRCMIEQEQVKFSWRNVEIRSSIQPLPPFPFTSFVLLLRDKLQGPSPLRAPGFPVTHTKLHLSNVSITCYALQAPPPSWPPLSVTGSKHHHCCTLLLG